jgi:predicted metalloprotease with PDZ domain
MKRLLLASLAIASLAAAAPVLADPLFQMQVKPSQLDPAKGTAVLDVVTTVEGVKVPAGQTLLSHLNGAPGIRGAFLVEDLTATDDRGPVPLVDGAKSGPRTWTSSRDVEGKLVVRYRRPIDNAVGGGLTTIPHVDGPGLFGIANMLFVLPPQTPARYHFVLDWDLSAMPAGSTAVTALGEGKVDIASMPLTRLTYAMMMAGQIKREPDPPQGAFSAVWTGAPTFDVKATMQWASKLHGYMSKFFADPKELPYHVFMRDNPAGNGVAAPMAFAIGYKPDTSPQSVQYLLGHEMTHTWTAADIGKWYSEGNAVYYQTQLPWRAGLMPIEKRLADINLTAARYYTNDVMHAPDSDVLPKFWSDLRYNVLSYDRGAIYFAVLNGKIKRASGGKRSVDDLIRAMVQLDREEKTITEQTWIDMLRKELSDEGPAIHKAMISGQATLIPESGDYGPCFRRVAVKIPRFDLGFGPQEVGRRTVVENLRPDSNAAKAGLKEGDKISYQFSTDTILRDPNMMATMHVTRGDQTFDVSYLPRGELRDAYQWERTDVPESACK